MLEIHSEAKVCKEQSEECEQEGINHLLRY